MKQPQIRTSTSPIINHIIRLLTLNIHDLPRSLTPTNRQHLKPLLLKAFRDFIWIQKTDLKEHARLVPIYTLTPHFASTEPDDSDDDNFDFLVRGRYPGEDPVHLTGVFELHVEFVDDVVDADGAGDEAHVEGRRRGAQEVVFVEAFEF